MAAVAVAAVAVAVSAAALIPAADSAARSARPVPAAPADQIDWATLVDVDRYGNVWVGFHTDVLEFGVVRAFSPAGQIQATWTTRGSLGGLAVDWDGSVVVGLDQDDRVEIREPGGADRIAWSQPGMIANLAAGAAGWNEPSSVYALRESAGVAGTPGTRPVSQVEVVRVGFDGTQQAAWPVDGRAYDVAFGGLGSPPEGVVYVADANSPLAGTANHVVSYDVGGNPIDSLEVAGEVRGMDVSLRGHLVLAVVSELAAFGRLEWRDAAGSGGSSCVLPGLPVDLAAVNTVAPLPPDVRYPDVWAILQPPLADPPLPSLYRLRADCSVVAAWSPEHLAGVITPTPDPHTPTAVAHTPTTVADTPTTVAHTPTSVAHTPTPTVPPLFGTPIYLPSADRPDE